MGNYQKIPNIYLLDHKIKKYKVGEFENVWCKVLKDIDWVVTEKIDGSNASVVWDGNRVTLNSHEGSLQVHPTAVSLMEATFCGPDNEVKFEEIFHDKPVTIYGELFGGKCKPRDSAYPYYPEPHFIVFDVQIGGYWLDRHNVEDVADKLGLECVPVIGVMKLEEAYDKLIEIGNTSIVAPSRSMEGVVCRPILCFNNKLGERIICKIKRRYMET